MLTCYMCGETKPEAEFAFANMAKGTRQRHCRKCQAAYRRAHYLANRGDYIRREVARIDGYRSENRALLLAYLLTHPCVDCGEANPVLLDFDHRDPTSKRSEVGRLASSKPWRDVLAEIEKCDVRCANCHRRRTARQFGWGKLTRSASKTEHLPVELEIAANEGAELQLRTTAEETKRCRVCGEMKPLDQFAIKNGRGLRATKCRACQRAYSRVHYRLNRDSYLARAARRRKLDRENCRQRIYDYLVGHPCIDCGETDPIVLDFDHRDRATKRGTISRLATQLSWSKLEVEIALCDVRCANCHRARTAQQFGWAKGVARTA